MRELPEEIGDLASLNILTLNFSYMTSLPPFVGKLQNLTVLDLEVTKKFSTPPEEIGDLVSLKVLNLNMSMIRSFPSSVKRLRNLESLNLWDTSNFQGPGFDFLLMLAQRCPLMRCIKTNGSLDAKEQNKLDFTLARNRARSRMRVRTMDKDSIGMTPNLWPLLLKNATSAFKYDFNKYDRFASYEIPNQDAMYELLIVGRGSFTQVLRCRSQQKGSSERDKLERAA